MATSSAVFAINGGSAGVKASVASGAAVTATLSSIANVTSVVWTISGTDETSSAASYTLVQSGSVGQTVACNALTPGTAAILQATINGGKDSQTGLVNFANTRATAKFFVATPGGAEVGCAGENYESDPNTGSSGIVNAAVRAALGGNSSDGINAAVYGTTTVFDFNLGKIQTVVMTGNITTLTLSNMKNGARYLLVFIQDSAGSHTLALPATMKPSGGTFTLTTPTASKRDQFYCWSDGTNLYEISRGMNV